MRELDHRGIGLVAAEEHLRDVERYALGPAGEGRRGDESIEFHGQRHAIVRRVEAVEVDHAELAHRRLLHLRDKRR